MKNALVLLVLVSATHTFADAWSPKASAFQARQAEERKKLGLDGEKAKKQYPTPEVRFGTGPGMASWLCPGQPTTILLQGKLAKGTLVGPISDSVQVVKEELTPKGWLATLTVKPGVPGPLTLQLIAPVSGISSTIELPVGCPREYVLDLKNGDRAVIKVIEGASSAPGEWFRKNKSVEARNFDVIADGKSFTFTARESAEDRERKKAAKPENTQDLAARQAALTDKMQGCAALPPAQMAPCIQKYSDELQSVMAAQTGAVQAAQSAAAPKVGCQQMTGTIDGKKLKGNGLSCASPNPYEEMPLTGVIK